MQQFYPWYVWLICTFIKRQYELANIWSKINTSDNIPCYQLLSRKTLMWDLGLLMILSMLTISYVSQAHLLLSVVSVTESFPLCELHVKALRPPWPSHSRSAKSLPLDRPSVSSRLVRRAALGSLFPLDGFCSPLDSELPLSCPGEPASHLASSSSSALATSVLPLLLTVGSELALLIIVKRFTYSLKWDNKSLTSLKWWLWSLFGLSIDLV